MVISNLKREVAFALCWACHFFVKEFQLACFCWRDRVSDRSRQADRTGHYICRPGGDRHRERAAVRRGAGAHARAARVAGAADRDLGGAARSSQARPASWSRCSRRCWRMRCDLRGQFRHHVGFAKATLSRTSALHWRCRLLLLNNAERNACSGRAGSPAWSRCSQPEQPVQIADLHADQAYLDGDPWPFAAVE